MTNIRKQYLTIPVEANIKETNILKENATDVINNILSPIINQSEIIGDKPTVIIHTTLDESVTIKRVGTELRIGFKNCAEIRLVETQISTEQQDYQKEELHC